MIRVFLIDDHELVRRGIAGVINDERDMEVVGESGTAGQSARRVAATRPDVAVIDVQLPDGWGVDVCRDLLSAHSDLTCLMLTAYDDNEAMSAAVLAGASGYVIKDVRGQGLVDSIRRVANGERLLSTGAAQQVVSRMAPNYRHASSGSRGVLGLNLRERQVLKLIGEGLTNRQIGERLELAEKTVKNYVSGLLAKLGMERRTQAAVYAAQCPQGPASP
jgi:DNA-binding NarL/FixJ family response regulator